MKRHILTDADGVLVNWNETFDKWIKTKGFVEIPDTIHNYNLSYRYKYADSDEQLGWETVGELVREFNESEEIANLPALKDAKEYVGILADHGFRFTCITSLSDAPHAREHRVNNLKSLFGDVFDEFVCLEIGASKEHILRKWANTNYYWIEDHFSNAEAGHEVGLRTVLVDADYNRQYHTDLFPRTSYSDPWKDISEMILYDYGLGHENDN